MRPVRLKMRNFRSFLGEHVIRFDRDLNMVTVVGEIGSGKTTILDAVCYALYGRTPTIGRTDSSQLIHTGRSSAQVSLLFETTRGQQWEAVRTIGTGASHVLYERSPDGTTPQTITLKQNVDPQIEHLVGFDYQTFSRSVMLAQGQFAQLLRASQTEREATLRNVMGLERFRRIRRAARDHRDGLARAEHKLRESVLVRSEARAEHRGTVERLAGVARRLDTASGLVSEWEGLRAVAPRLRYEREQLDQWLGQAEPILAELRNADIERLETEHRDLSALTDRLRGELDDRQQRYDTATEKLASPAIVKAEQLERTLDSLRTQISTHETRLAESRARLRVVADQADGLPAAVEQAERRLADAHRQATVSAAARLRAGLAPGDECPVCAQAVPAGLPSLPGGRTDEHAVERLAAEKGRLQSRAEQARRETTHLEKVISETETLMLAAREQREQARSELDETLGTVTVADLRENQRAAAAARTAARERLDAHLRATGDVRTRYEQALGLKDRAGRLLNSPVGTVVEAAGELTAEAARRADRRGGIVGELADIADRRNAMTRRCGGMSPPRAEAALATETETLNRRKAQLERQVEELDVLEKELADTRADLEMYQTIYRDLADHQMLRWLLETERENLAAAADGHYRRLTDGRYGIVTDGDDLAIVDGDTLRDPATLSGGETFLASLALAFGLGETITRSVQPVRCFFLDEGFGSLDNAHIDQALNGVETMATGDKLVVLVSHLDSVKERSENTIQLVKSAAGNTRQAGLW